MKLVYSFLGCNGCVYGDKLRTVAVRTTTLTFEREGRKEGCDAWMIIKAECHPHGLCMKVINGLPANLVSELLNCGAITTSITFFFFK